MDAQAHLLSLGWAGPGHSLDSRPHKGRRGLAYDPKQAQNNGNGLIKPLLISQKKNTFGIGKKAHEPAAGNEWWLKGFETALSNVGKSESERTSGTATPELKHFANGHRAKHMDLYSFFIKGAEMEGTIGLQRGEQVQSSRPKKRKSDTQDPQRDSSSSSEDHDDSTETSMRKKRKSKEGAEEFEQIGAFLQVRDKNEKRRRRKQKGDAIEEFQQVGEFFEARSARRKASQSSPPPLDSPEPAQVTAEATDDTEEERRRRRKERKATKAAKVLKENSDNRNATAPRGANGEDRQHLDKKPDDNSAAREARRAERRRRRKELELK